MERYWEFLKRRNKVRVVLLKNALGSRTGDELEESEVRSN